LLLLIFLGSFCKLQGECYSEYWQKLFLTMWKTESFQLGTFVRIDTDNHMVNIRSVQISEQMAFNVSKEFTFEFHYTYIHGHALVPHADWQWQHRLEIEGNRTFYFSNGNKISTRNRLEIRKLENNPVIQYRLRQLTMFTMPLEKGHLKLFSVYNEVFYDLTHHRFTEDRLYPCQFTFAVNERVKIDLFFMMRYYFSASHWHRSAVLGTQLIF